MSGLEPLVALGLACNVLQLVELGKDAITLIRAIYHEGAKPDEQLTENAVTLETFANEVKTHAQTGKKKYELQLQQSAEKCATAARELCEEIRFLVANDKQGRLASVVKTSVKIIRCRRRLEKLQGNLDQAEKQMNTGLLAQIM